MLGRAFRTDLGEPLLLSRSIEAQHGVHSFGRGGEDLSALDGGKERDAHEDRRRDSGKKRAGQPAKRHLAAIGRTPPLGEDRRLGADRAYDFLIGHI